MEEVEPLLFVLDNPSASYYPGEVVTGRLIVTFDSQKRIKGIKLKCIGKGHVFWSEGSGQNRRSYSNFEDYFCNKIHLIENPHDEELAIEEGKYTYHFAFQLPLGIPSSYEDGDNHTGSWIRYYLNAIIKKKGMFQFNIEEKIAFKVKGIVDLSVEQVANEHFEIWKQKNVGCPCGKSGPVGFVLRVPKIGYLPGEHLSFNAEIFNRSTKPISAVMVRFKQEVEYRSSGGSKLQSYKTLMEICGPQVKEKATVTWNSSEDISDTKIKQIPPTNLGGSSGIIALRYIIEITLEIPGAIDLAGGIPIIIGTIPVPMVTESDDCIPSTSQTREEQL